MPQYRPEVIIRWTPEDIQHLCPTLDLEQAGEVLMKYGGLLRNRSTDLGWEILEARMIEDGYEVDQVYTLY